MKPKRTVILVADAGHARAFLAVGNALTQISSFTLTQDVPPSREIADDRPGRTHESTTARRSAYEPPTDPHRKVERNFAGEVADRLAAAAAEHDATRVVVIAPPVMLGDLRKAYPAALADRVALEIDKDLAPLAEHDLLQRLRDILDTQV